MTRVLKDSLGWGFALWALGYVLGIALFFAVPPALIGWVIMPIGMAATVWVLFTRVKGADMRHYLVLAIVWTAIAVAFDYLFIVRMFRPPDGYYKADVFVYYALTAALPLAVGWWSTQRTPRPLAG